MMGATCMLQSLTGLVTSVRALYLSTNAQKIVVQIFLKRKFATRHRYFPVIAETQNTPPG
jgi:hypothetical protein